MHVLVTGAHGFIGSHAVEGFLARGWRVRGLVSPWGSLDNLAAVRDHPGLEIVRADIRRPGGLPAAFEGVEAVLHGAARVADWGRWKEFEATNVRGTVHVVEAAAAAGAARVALISSVSVFRYTGFVDADARTLPRDPRVMPYARSKILAEDIVLSDDRVEGVVVRPGLWPFGRRDPTLDRIVTALRAGRLPLVGSGDTRLNTAYVGNLCDGLALALDVEGAAGRSYVVADDGAPTWSEVLSRLAGLLGVDPPARRIPVALARGVAAAVEGPWRAVLPDREPPLTRYRASLMARDVHFSIEHARRELGYRPAVRWEEGLARSVGPG